MVCKSVTCENGVIENREYGICVDVCGICGVFVWSTGGCICVGICKVCVRSRRIGCVWVYS